MALAAPAAADMVSLPPAKDNTLIEPTGAGGSPSSGAGLHVYAGRVRFLGQTTTRRGVLAFDVADAVPAGSTITSVTLTLTLTATSDINDRTIELRRLLADWGEGASDSLGGMGVPAQPGDATWVHTFFDTDLWDTPGGDFAATASSSTTVGFMNQAYTWPSTAQMVADVQGWLDDPASNFGWLLLGDESTIQTVKQFASRENPNMPSRPMLVIEFEPGAAGCPGNTNDDDVVDVADLLEVLGSWGPCPDCPGDLNGDDVVDVSDLLEVLGNWGPCPR